MTWRPTYYSYRALEAFRICELVSGRLRPLIEGGVVATTASLDAEALYSARGPAEYEQLCADRRDAY